MARFRQDALAAGRHNHPNIVGVLDAGAPDELPYIVMELIDGGSLAGWVELALLRSTLNRRIGRTGLPFSSALKLWSAAVAGTAAAWLVKLAIAPQQPMVAAVSILIPYGLVYYGITYGWKIPEARGFVGRMTRAVGRSISG